MRALLFGTIVLVAGCMRDTSFQCDPTRNDQCGSTGQCESVGACSFPSSACPSGRVYGDSQGSFSNDCVPTGMVMIDAALAEPVVCPGDYVTLPNSGPRAHKYKLLGTAAAWAAQDAICVGEGTFLAYPDGTNMVNAQLELDALRAFAGNDAWLGIDDRDTEGLYIRSRDKLAMSSVTLQLLNIKGNPNEKAGDDCLVIDNATINDGDCAMPKKAACECAP
jgi:hypothetical protein